MAELHLALWQSPAELVGLQARLDWLSAQCATAEGIDLALLPELFLSGYYVGEAAIAAVADEHERAVGAVAALAVRHGMAIAFGYPERRPDGLYNSACVIDSNGNCVLRHRKRILPPGFEAGCFKPGEVAPETVVICGVSVTLLVCYEVEFPEAVRACALSGAELILVPTALAEEWPVVARKVVPARAFENTVFIAYANHAGEERGERYLGESCIVSADGEFLARAGADSESLSACIDTGTLASQRARLPFLEECGRFRG